MTTAQCVLLCLLLAYAGVRLLVDLWIFEAMRAARVEAGRVAHMLRHDRANRDLAISGLWHRQDQCRANWIAIARWAYTMSNNPFARPAPPNIETGGPPRRRDASAAG